jgi:hypothetical protein
MPSRLMTFSQSWPLPVEMNEWGKMAGGSFQPFKESFRDPPTYTS